MDSKAKIWVLADDRAGNVSQCLGVAEALGAPFERKDIRYNALVRLPNWLIGARLLAVDKAHSSSLDAPYPELVIAAGRRTAPIAACIKTHSPHTKWVQLMWPGSLASKADLVVVPAHDTAHRHQNILIAAGAPHRVRPGIIQAAAETWQNEEGKSYHPPFLTVLVGGSSKDGHFTENHAHALGVLINDAASALGATVLITTSRRTGEAQEQRLKATLTCPYHWYDWRSGLPNPYMAYLGLGSAFIVTGDSMSMCSEACATGKPVYIYAPEGLASKKHQRFHNYLYAEGYARALEDKHWASWSYAPLQVAEIIADSIREKGWV